MEIVENKSNVDEKLVETLTTRFEKIEADFKTKKYMVDLKTETKSDLVKFYTESFLPGINWKGYECYAIAELSPSFKKAFDGKETALWNREHIEATFHFIKTFEGTGSIEFATNMRDFCDAFAKPMNSIQKDMQEMKDVATELQAAEQGISVEELIKGAQQSGPQ